MKMIMKGDNKTWEIKGVFSHPDEGSSIITAIVIEEDGEEIDLVEVFERLWAYHDRYRFYYDLALTATAYYEVFGTTYKVTESLSGLTGYVSADDIEHSVKKMEVGV